MPILTEEEFKAVKKKPKKERDHDETPREKPVLKTGPSLGVPLTEIQYILLHPENPVNGKLNFSDVIMIEGKPHKRECINGIVRTTDKDLVSFLITREYEVIEKKEIRKSS